MHMISKKDLSDAEMDTLTKSCSPTIVISANGEVQTHEEATVYVKELDIFLTMKVRDSDTLQHGKLRSYCGSRLVKFVFWILINFKDTFKTGESFLIIFFNLIFFTYSK